MNWCSEKVINLATTKYKGYFLSGLAPRTDCDLSIGEVVAKIPSRIEALLQQSLDFSQCGYVDPAGLFSLRSAYIQHQINFTNNVEPNQILVTAGAKEAFWLVCAAVLSVDDVVLVPSPGWNSFSLIAESFGSTTIPYLVTTPEETTDAIKSLIRTHIPRLLVVNSPHNPTGIEFSASQLKSIIEEANASGISVAFDEVYRPFGDLPETSALSVLSSCFSDHHPHFVIDSFSKWGGMAGLRVGFLISSQKNIRNIQILRSSISSCLSVPAQQLAVTLLSNSSIQEWRKHLIKENLQSRLHLAKILEKNGISVNSHGSIYLWCKPSKEQAQTGVLHFYNQKVKVSKGELFDAFGYVRVCSSIFPAVKKLVKDNENFSNVNY